MENSNVSSEAVVKFVWPTYDIQFWVSPELDVGIDHDELGDGGRKLAVVERGDVEEVVQVLSRLEFECVVQSPYKPASCCHHGLACAVGHLESLRIVEAKYSFHLVNFLGE